MADLQPSMQCKPNPTSPHPKGKLRKYNKRTTRVITTNQNFTVKHWGTHRFKRSGGLTVLPDRVVRTAGFGLRGGTHSSSVVRRVATGTAVCGDRGTCGVWGLSGVLGTGNTGVTCTGCCSVSAGFAAATKAERFRRSVPLSVVTRWDRGFSVFSGRFFGGSKSGISDW